MAAQILLSTAFLILGLGLLGAGRRSLPYAAVVVLVALVSVLLLTAHLVADYFTGQGINEAVIYHLRYGLEGAGFAEYAGLMGAALGGIAGLLALLWWASRFGRARVRGGLGSFGNLAAVASVCLSVATQPASAALLRLWPGTSAGLAVADASADPAVLAEFARSYRQPKADRRGPARDLVFIYAESLERTYFDETIFPGLITELRALERRADSFTGIEELPGTEWTIAGMVASQCGIPLFTPGEGNALSRTDLFLPAATCLGDLLKREGYRLAYYGGANLSFAGKGKFYATHGFRDVAGRAELVTKLPDPGYVNSWGLYDDSLFDLAFEKFVELSRAQDRFALFLLTLDTHHPEGHVSRECTSVPYRNGANPMLNAVRCTDRLISQFVRRIRSSPRGRHAVIVIASDHLAMQNSAHAQLARGLRRNLLMVLDPQHEIGRLVSTRGSTLDVAPTVMAYLGYDAEIGLGTSLRKTGEEPEKRRAHVRHRLEAWRGPLAQFWAFPRIERYFQVDAEEGVVRIDGRAFAIPALIEVDGGLQTVIRFPRAGADAQEAVRPAAGKPFLLVAPCISKSLQLPDGKVCLFGGRENRIRTQFIVRGTTRFAPDEIRSLISAAS